MPDSNVKTGEIVYKTDGSVTIGGVAAKADAVKIPAPTKEN